MSFFSTRKFLCSTRYTSWNTLHNIPINRRKISVLKEAGLFDSTPTMYFLMLLRAELVFCLLGMLCNVVHLYINLACLSVCLVVSNKRQNGWTDQTQILCGTSRGSREGLCPIRLQICNLKIFYLKSFNFVKFNKC